MKSTIDPKDLPVRDNNIGRTHVDPNHTEIRLQEASFGEREVRRKAGKGVYQKKRGCKNQRASNNYLKLTRREQSSTKEKRNPCLFARFSLLYY